MANTYSRLYVHIVFVVKHRKNLLSLDWKEELHKYITAIVTQNQQKMMIINSVRDHVHMLIGTNTSCNLADLMREVKTNSSKWINETKPVVGKFEWQKGVGAFSVGPSGVDRVIRYIQNQEEHHRKKTFRVEYIEFLQTYQIEFNPKFIFEDVGVPPTAD